MSRTFDDGICREQGAVVVIKLTVEDHDPAVEQLCSDVVVEAWVGADLP
jgi:hypothetical protein